MGEPKFETTTTTTTTTTALMASDEEESSAAPPLPPSKPPVSLLQPSLKRKHRSRTFRVFRSIFRSFPIISPACKLPSIPGGLPEIGHRGHVGDRITGTLFGYRKGRVSLSIQESPKCFPTMVVELGMQTHALQKEMSAGMVRIALECEKRAERQDKMIRLLDEPVWSMYCNGKKTGYGIKREANAEDLHVMELLKAVSMGAGVLPGSADVEGLDCELAYLRAHFDHVVGSRDSETLYMLSPDGSTSSNGPELSIFFVRI